jgi:hypothetical protein
MSIISTTTIFNRLDGSSLTLPADQAALKTYYERATWSAQPLPPPGWEFIEPRYLVTRDLQPAQKNRFRFENPFSETSSNDSWQFGDRFYAAGETIERCICWPHASMRGLNFSGERVLSYFINTIKSRLQQSPWSGGRIRLESGIGGALSFEVKSPSPAPFNSRPAA